MHGCDTDVCKQLQSSQLNKRIAHYSYTSNPAHLVFFSLLVPVSKSVSLTQISLASLTSWYSVLPDGDGWLLLRFLPELLACERVLARFVCIVASYFDVQGTTDMPQTPVMEQLCTAQHVAQHAGQHITHSRVVPRNLRV